MKRVLVFLLLYSLVLFVRGIKIAEFEDIYKPRQMIVSGNDLYVVDGETIKLFSIKEMVLKKMIGKKGAGPGEFRFWPRMSLHPETLFAYDRIPVQKKIVLFSRSGEFIEEKKLPPFTTMIKVNDNYLARELKRSGDRKTIIKRVTVVDSRFNLIGELFSETEDRLEHNPIMKGKKGVDFEPFPRYRRAETDGNYIYVIDTRKGFYFEIFNDKGIRLNIIEKKEFKYPFPEEARKKLLKKLIEGDEENNTGITYNYILPDYFPEILDIRGEGNRIFVYTGKYFNDKNEILTLDHKGSVLKTSLLPQAFPSSLWNNRFYYLKDNEEDQVWELHVVNL